MQIVKTVIWQEDDAWVGYLQDYPDYWTQGDNLDDLKEHLKDLYADLSAGLIPGARRSGERRSGHQLKLGTGRFEQRRIEDLVVLLECC